MQTYLKKTESNFRSGSKIPKPPVHAPCGTRFPPAPRYCFSEPCIQRKVYIGNGEAQYEYVFEEVTKWCTEHKIPECVVPFRIMRMMGKFLKMDNRIHGDTVTGVYYFDSIESLIDRLAMGSPSIKVSTGNVGQGDATLLQSGIHELMVDLGPQAKSVPTAFWHKKIRGAYGKCQADGEAEKMTVFEFKNQLLELLGQFLEGVRQLEQDEKIQTGLPEKIEIYRQALCTAADRDGVLQCIKCIAEAHSCFCRNAVEINGMTCHRMKELIGNYNSFFTRNITFTDAKEIHDFPLLMEITQQYMRMSSYMLRIELEEDMLFDHRDLKPPSVHRLIEIAEMHPDSPDVSLLLEKFERIGIIEITGDQIAEYIANQVRVENVSEWIRTRIITDDFETFNIAVDIMYKQCHDGFADFLKHHKDLLLKYRIKGSFPSKYLWQADWTEIPAVITHEHADHTGGKGGLKGRILAVSQYSLQNEPCSTSRRLARYGLTPVKAPWTDERERDPNATSLMVHYDLRGFSGGYCRVYFLGDSPIEKLQGSVFLPPLPVHVIIFPHHGSETANGDKMPPELFGTEITYGIVSSGAGHKYLLPSCQALLDHDTRGLAAKDGASITLRANDGTEKKVIMRSTMNIGYAAGTSRVPGYVVFAANMERSSFYTKAWFPAPGDVAGPEQQHGYAEGFVHERLRKVAKRRREAAEP